VGRISDDAARGRLLAADTDRTLLFDPTGVMSLSVGCDLGM